MWFTNYFGNSIGRVQAPETPSELCQSTVSDVETSAKYQSLPGPAQNAIKQALTGACNQLATINPKLTPRQQAFAIAAYKLAVTALAKGGWLTSTQASSLTTLADNLTLT